MVAPWGQDIMYDGDGVYNVQFAIVRVSTRSCCSYNKYYDIVILYYCYGSATYDFLFFS